MTRNYEDYKQSGSCWIGSIPHHWRTVMLKQLVDPLRRVTYGIVQPGPPDESGRCMVRGQDYSSGWADQSLIFRVSASVEEPYRRARLKAGDLVITIVGAGTGNVGVVPDYLAGANITQTTARIAPNYEKAVGEFLKYVLISDVGRRQVQAFQKGAAQPGLNLEHLVAFRVPFPPLPEQQAIAAFLDRETVKIDGLVEEQRRLITLLREKRQAVISHAVTKGLDPTAPLKPSGIDWLGDIPAHWTAIPIRKVARMESGHTPSRSRPDWWENCTVPWFSLADVWQIRSGQQEYVAETAEKVSELGLANSSARLLPKGTVILSRTASVGYSAIMAVDMATTQDFANWVCGNRLLPAFLLYCLRAMSGEFKRLRMGSTHNTIYMPDIASLAIALPPKREQTSVVEHIRNEARRIDDLIGEAQKASKLLIERRAALISAAVTGKIDVRATAQDLTAAA